MKRRALLAGIGVVVLGGTAGLTAVAADSPSTPGTSTTTKDEQKRSTAKVQRTDLIDREDLAGTLGFGEPTELAVGRPGVITALPAAGTVVERGGSVAEVNGLPVPLLFGTRPFWRKLTAEPVGADGQPTDQLEGPDVRILEENLQALGFIDSGSDAKVDDTFTGSTATGRAGSALDRTRSCRPSAPRDWSVCGPAVTAGPPTTSATVASSSTCHASTRSPSTPPDSSASTAPGSTGIRHLRRSPIASVPARGM